MGMFLGKEKEQGKEKSSLGLVPVYNNSQYCPFLTA